MNKHTTKRRGFTMIELIFVIVILGILASVAIPKLAATRDDAKVASVLAELSTLKNDMSAYYTARGTYVAADIKDMTNVALYTANNCSTKLTAITTADVTTAPATFYYCTTKTGGGLEDIISFAPVDTNGTLNVAKINATGNVGVAVQATDAFKALAITVQNGGSRVSF